MTASDDPVRSMLEQATRTLTGAGQKASDATVHAQQVLHQLQSVSHQIDHYATFLLLPLCLALLILHEHYRSVTEGGSFRVAQVLGRTVAVVAAVLAYPRLCGLLCGVAGAGSGWLTSTNYLDLYNVGTESLTTSWDRLGGLSDMPKFIGMVIVWVVLMMSVLFAYVAASLLSVVQAVSLSIFLGLGKACIVVSLVPGVGLAKSWARSLAQVAAWSTVAGVISGLLSTQNISIAQLIVAGQFTELLKASAHFIILALTTLAVPLITAKLFAGGAAGLSEVLPGFLAARGFAAGIGDRLQRLRGQRGDMGAAGSARAGAHAADNAARVHKIPYERAQRHPVEGVARSTGVAADRYDKARAFARRLPVDRPYLAPSGATRAGEPPARAPATPPPGASAPAPARPPRAEPDTLIDQHIEVTGETA